MSKLGPHVIRPTGDALDWARHAGVVKALDDPAALKAAPDGALRIFRAYFPETEQRMDADANRAAATILGRLGGYRHPLLYVETFNETQAQAADLVAFHRRLVPLLHAAGVKVAGPAWSTGAYTADDWAAFRAAGWCGLDAISLHAYWGSQGFTIWHALRWRQFWQQGDPPVFVTECGRDRVEGGKGGWRADGLSEDAAAAELLAYDAELHKDRYVIAATPFTAGPTPDWSNFDTDPLSGRMVAHAGLLPALPDYAPPTPAPAPKPIPKPEPTMPNDWCPFATKRPIALNFWPDRAGQKAQAIVDHVADGNGSLFGWFSQPSAEVSAHFWIGKDGSIEQYVPLSAAAWANGPLNNPNLAIPLIAACKRNGTNPNRVTVSLEFEGKPSDFLTPAQTIAGRKVHVWLRDTLGIPLDRLHVLGHRDFDSVTRSNCPGPNFPWSEMMDKPAAQPKLDIVAERDALWAKADQLEKAGYSWLGQGVKAAVALSKGER